jgi:hypothetical protein
MLNDDELGGVNDINKLNVNTSPEPNYLKLDTSP